MRRPWLRWVAGLALVLVIGAALLSEPGAWLLDAVGRLRDAGPAGLIGFALLYAAATVLALPAGLLTLAAGFTWGVAGGALAVWTGAVVGATGSFLLGRTLLRAPVAQRLAADPRLGAVDAAVRDEGLRLVLLLRLSPLFPFNVLNYGLGVTALSLRDYAIGTAVGIVPGMVVYLWVGSTVSSLGDLARGAPSAGGPGVALSALGLVATIAVTVQITKLARRALDARLGTTGAHDGEAG
jgi:uncharacterized membrane protein YdjX (TVP38/TMEM64 family)